MSVTAVVPLRGGAAGKTRLADGLDPAERGLLVAALARHVVTTLLASDVVARVLVVTGDPGFAAAAVPAHDRVRLVAQPPDRPGLNPAVELGRETAVTDGAERLLVVHADLAALTVEDVHALIAAGSTVCLAPDRAGRGTNAVVVDTDLTGFAFRFGPDSLRAHRAEAARLGVQPAAVTRSGTATDLDTAEDWAALPPDVRQRIVDAVPATARLAVR